MSNIPNFNAQLEPEQLDGLRRLAKHLGYTLIAGKRAGDGSVRQMLAALGNAVETQGVRNVAATIRGLLPDIKTD